MRKKIFFLVFFLLIFSNFSFYGSLVADEQEDVSPFVYFYPPVNSFGLDSWKIVNWSYFEDDKFFYETNAEELEVEWNKSSDIVSKFKYKFKTEYEGLYYLNISFVDLYLEDVLYIGNYTFELVYLDGSMYFDFTDIIDTTDFEYDYEILSNGFKLVLFNYLDVGEWELDPIFGETSIQSSFAYIYDGWEDDEYLFGHKYTMGSNDGVADNITVYVKGWSQTAYLQCAIYEVIDCTSSQAGDLVSSTQQVQVLNTDDNKWIVFPFSEPKPCLTAYEDYFLVVAHITDLSGGGDNLIAMGTGTCGFKKMFSNGAVLTDPLTGETNYDYTPSIYCSYTEGCDEGCTNESIVSPVSTVNGTTGVNPCNTLNWTLQANSTCCNYNTVNISANGLYHNTSGVNGTYWLNITNLNCGQNITIYVNSSGCNSTMNYSWFWFTTESCCVITNESFKFDAYNFNQSTYCKDYNETFLNVSGYINSSCNTTIDFVKFTLSTGNTSQWTNESEGLYWVNWTGLNLSCNTNYTFLVNITTNLSSCNNYTINNTYYFWTCPCYSPPVNCSCLITNPYPSNHSTGLNWSGVNYLNLTALINISCGNFTGIYANVSVKGIGFHNVSVSSNGTVYFNMSNNYTCGINYTWYVNLTGSVCNKSVWFWFVTETCNESGQCNCSDFFNESELILFLTQQGYIKESDNIQIEPTNGFLSIILTLVFFVIFFIYGYTVNKRSAGAFLMFSGFIFLSLEYLIASYLQSIFLAFFGAFGIFIIILGIRKWFFMPEGEKTKSEGQ